MASQLYLSYDFTKSDEQRCLDLWLVAILVEASSQGDRSCSDLVRRLAELPIKEIRLLRPAERNQTGG